MRSGKGHLRTRIDCDSEATGFAMTHSSVPMSELQNLATQIGMQSKVKLHFPSILQGKLMCFVTWRTSVHPLHVLDPAVTFDAIAATAQQMSGEGYIITASGGNETSGFVLVGTK